MTTLMVKMIVAELRNKVTESGMGLIAGILIIAFAVGFFTPGMWWTDNPIHEPQPLNTVERVFENPHATPSIIPPGAFNNNHHCLVQCDGM